MPRFLRIDPSYADPYRRDKRVARLQGGDATTLRNVVSLVLLLRKSRDDALKSSVRAYEVEKSRIVGQMDCIALNGYLSELLASRSYSRAHLCEI